MKKAAGTYAADHYIKDGMTVGLGTGSTSYFFIQRLLERCKEGLNIQVVGTSKASEEMAKKANVSCIPHENVTDIDITVDGADLINPNFEIFKGGGGACFREKIIATASKEWIVIIDESKLHPTLFGTKLPVEILPFCYQTTIKQIHALGFEGELRLDEKEKLYQTDNGNYLLDIQLTQPLDSAKSTHDALIKIVGVCETGLFFDMASHLIIGKADGSVEVREAK